MPMPHAPRGVPLGLTPLVRLRGLLNRRGADSGPAPLELTCYGKADCSLCDKAKAPVERLVRASNGRVVARWVDILSDEALAARWGERIPVICAGETILAEGKVSELRLRRAIEAHLRQGGG